jgi:hypothetical protein
MRDLCGVYVGIIKNPEFFYGFRMYKNGMLKTKNICELVN